MEYICQANNRAAVMMVGVETGVDRSSLIVQWKMSYPWMGTFRANGQEPGTCNRVGNHSRRREDLSGIESGMPSNCRKLHEAVRHAHRDEGHGVERVLFSVAPDVRAAVDVIEYDARHVLAILRRLAMLTTRGGWRYLGHKFNASSSVGQKW